ncbi:hypothetical protein ACTFIZ_008778 [Dictyostelium cf. discoideum]
MIAGGLVVKSESGFRTDNTYKLVTKSDSKEDTFLALIILGSIFSLIGFIFLSFSFCFSSSTYMKNIKSFLLVENKNCKSRGIIWKIERQLVENYYKYYIIISFLRTIQRFQNSETEIEPISDNSQYYPPSSQQQQTSNSNSFKPYSNSYSPKSSNPQPSFSQYYPPSPTPYSQNSDEPSSSSSSSSFPPPTNTTIKSPPPPKPLQLPYIYEEAQSVPLPQEILDMLELEERNAAKNI